MKQILHLFLFILLMGISITACREDRDDIIPYDDTKITTTISGFVTDEGGNEIASANVSYQGKSMLTDEHGFFSFDNMLVNNQANIRIEKVGYFEGSRTIFPRSGKRQWIRVQLMTKSFDMTFGGSTGGDVQSEGVKISFPSDAIIDANGNSYSGTVHIALKYLDPSKVSTGVEMPGSLVGISESGFMQAMLSYSMIAVELQGDSGQKLNLGNGKKATVSFPIPASFASAAPNSIPLWYFDLELGFWKEEGKATKVGSTYVGEVGHFSFWNCDIPFPFIQLSGTIIDPNENPISQLSVRLTRASNGMAASGYTNDNGVFEGKVPKDESFLLEVLDNCGNVIHSQNIGPFSSDVTLPAIQLTASSYLVTVSGTVVDCDLLPIDSAYVYVNAGGYKVLAFSNITGAFSTSVIDCSPTATIVVNAIDLDNLTESGPLSFPSAPLVDAGQIQVCSNPLDEYINYTIVGLTGAETILEPNSSDSSGLGVQINGGNQTPNGFAEFFLSTVEQMQLGAMTIKSISIYRGSNGTSNSYHGTEGTINVTSVSGLPGTYFIGTFTATNVEGPSGPFTVTGSFRVKKDM